MDNFEYLNQISRSTHASKHAKPAKSGLAKIPIAKFAIGGVVLFFLLMAIGALLGSIKSKPQTLTKQLYTRTMSVNENITTFNRSVKSSRLRAIGASLSSVLTHTSKQLSDYLSSTSSDKDPLALDKSLAESEASFSEAIKLSLTNAKLNGILDRTYENQLSLQVSLLLSLNSQLLARTKDPNLIQILNTFGSSLQTIHQNLENYSNPSN